MLEGIIDVPVPSCPTSNSMDSIDSTHCPVFRQMEGSRVFAPEEWEASESDGTSFAAADLKKCLEGLARHLFGNTLFSTIFNSEMQLKQ
ncbi:hypothetical protein S83_062318, partial [Arachis hypogaea]